jgi:hypothetical protein
MCEVDMREDLLLMTESLRTDRSIPEKTQLLRQTHTVSRNQRIQSAGAFRLSSAGRDFKATLGEAEETEGARMTTRREYAEQNYKNKSIDGYQISEKHKSKIVPFS